MRERSSEEEDEKEETVLREEEEEEEEEVIVDICAGQGQLKFLSRGCQNEDERNASAFERRKLNHT